MKIKFNYFVNLCYLINKQGKVLLQFKARGFGQGKWNGVGGKVEPGETIEQSAAREIKEETGLIVKKLEEMGQLEFIFTRQPDWNSYCHVFICRQFSGRLQRSQEGKLKWFGLKQIPLDKMWDDDKYWLLDLLTGKKLKMRFYFDQEGKVIKYSNL